MDLIKDKNPWKNITPSNSNFPGKYHITPGSRAAHSCEMINNKLYIFGGWNGKKALNDLYILNLDTFQW